MKYSRQIRVSDDGGSELFFPAAGPFSFRVKAADKTLLETGRVRCGAFQESQGLPEKHRVHEARGMLSCEIESRTVIPFGCEYEVSRTSGCAGNLLQVTTEIRARTGGKVGSITLEPVRFPGKLASCEFLVYGKKTFRSAREYEGEEPVVSLRVRYPDGSRAEFCCGSDLWRHRAGMHTPGAAGRFRIAPLEEGGVELTREVLCYAQDAEVEKRPWRFQSLFGWSRADAPAAEHPEADYEIRDCFCSAPERRRFREWVRRAGGTPLAAVAHPRICLDAAHAERAWKKELEHCDLAEYVSAWLWANRQLQPANGSLVFLPGETIFRDSPVMQNVGRVPGTLELPEK